MTKINEERFYLAHSLHSITDGSQGRNLDAGTETETMKESLMKESLLVCFAWIAQLPFLHNLELPVQA